LIDEKDADKGILVSFLGGATCVGSDTPSLNGLPRKVLFRLECAEQADSEVSCQLP